MSKKNCRATRNRLHTFDLSREKKAAEGLKKEADKRQLKVERKGGVAKTKKNKGIRVRKGVHIKGIKVVDSDTKKKVKKLLKADVAARTMDVDKPKKNPLQVTKKSLKVDGVAKSKTRRNEAAADKIDKMQE